MSDRLQKARAQCLSTLDILAAHSNERVLSSAEAGHVATCAACQHDFATLRADAEQLRHAPVPDFIAGKSTPAWHLPRWALAAAAPVMACLLLVILNTPSPQQLDAGSPGVKGGGSEVLVSVVRNGQPVYEDVPPEALKLLEGDHLRIRVADAHNAYVIMRLKDPNVTLFSGALDANGFIPDGLRYTTADPTVVEVKVCEAPSNGTGAEAHCTLRTFAL